MRTIGDNRLLLDESWQSGPYRGAKTCLCTPLSGQAQPGSEPDPEVAAIYAITEVRWFDLRSRAEWGAKVFNDPQTYRLMLALQQVLGYASGEAELEALESYLRDPSPASVLVFVATDDLNRNLKAVKLVQDLATIVECDPLAGSRGAIEWVMAEAAGEGVRVEPAAARLLATLAGGDITPLRAEFERAVLFASGEGIVTEAAVREIASAPTTQDPWAMTNAIERRQAAEALRAAQRQNT